MGSVLKPRTPSSALAAEKRPCQCPKSLLRQARWRAWAGKILTTCSCSLSSCCGRMCLLRCGSLLMSGGTRCQSSTTGTKVPGPPPELDEAGVPGLAVPGAPASVCSVRLEGAVPALHTQPALFWGQGEGTGWGQLSWEPGAGDWSRQGPQVLDGPMIYNYCSSPSPQSGWQAILDK